MSKWIKIAILVLLLLGACYLFGAACREVSQSFALLLSPDNSLLEIIAFILIAFCTLVIAAGLTIILIKPFLLDAVAFLLASISLLLGWRQFSWITILFSLTFFLLSICLTALTQQSLEGRIKFSVQPYKEKRGFIVFTLVLLVCASLFLSSKDYIEENGFKIPNKYFMMFMGPLQEGTLSQIPEEERESAETELNEQFENLIQEFQETKIEPLEPYIPLAIAAMAFFPLFSLMNATAFIPIILLDFLIRILILIKFAHIVTEDKPVERVMLNQ